MKYLLSNKYQEATFILGHQELKLEIDHILADLEIKTFSFRPKNSNLPITNESFFESLKSIDSVVNITELDNYSDEIGSSFLLLLIEAILNTYNMYKNFKKNIKDSQRFFTDKLKTELKVNKPCLIKYSIEYD